MLLSVAMCTYNGARHIDEQLATIAGQELLPDELVISDDGSTDKTVDQLEKFARTAPFDVRILRNATNLGYSNNFRQAVGQCSGDLIALSDQDDLWYPHKLARLAKVFRENPSVEGVFSNGDLVDGSSNPIGRTLWDSFRFGDAAQAEFRAGGSVDALLRRNVVTGMAFAFRSSIRGFMASRPQTWMHDNWLAILLALRSSLFALPECLVGYRIHASQQVGIPLSLEGKRRWIQERGVQAYLQRVREINLDEYLRTAVQFDDLAAYLQDRGDAEGVLVKIRAKAAHARRGAMTLTRGRVHRWSIVLPRLESYARFSPNGLRAIPRDLFI